MSKKHSFGLAAPVILLPVLLATTTMAASPTAAQQLSALTKAADAEPYVQTVITQREKIGYQGQSELVDVNMKVDAEHVGSSLVASMVMTVKSSAGNVTEHVFIKSNREYANTGSGWQYVGAIKNASLQSLSNTGNLVYKSVKVRHTKKGEQFTATVDPKTFASVVEQAVSAFVPASGTGKPSASVSKLMAKLFQHIHIKTVTNAAKVSGAERLTSQHLAMGMTISAKQLQAIATAEENQTSVTKSVYGEGNTSSGSVPVPTSSVTLALTENASFAYKHVKVVTPKNLPKA